MRRFLLTFTILIVAFALCACGRPRSTDAAVLKAEDDEQKISDPQWSGEGKPYIYTRHASLPIAEGDAEEYILLAAESCQGDIYQIMEALFSGGYILHKNGEIIYASPDYFYASTSSPSGIWILENAYFDGESHYRILLLSTEGDVINSIDLSAVSKGSKFARTLTCSNGKLFVVADNNTLLVVDEKGELVSSVDLPGEAYPVVSNSGEICVVREAEDNNQIYKLNNSFSELSLVFTVQKGFVFDGGGTYYMLLETPNGLYSLDANGRVAPIVIWRECKISMNGLYSVQIIDGDRFLCLTNEDCGILSPTDPSQIKDKTELCLATVEPSGALYAMVESFNLHNDEYYIRVVDYSNNGAFNLSDASTKLNLDIIGGNAPDLIAFGLTSPYQYVRKGILADLSEFFATDAEMQLEDLAVLNAISSHGRVFFVSGSFNLETLVGRYSQFGDRHGWTMSEYLEIESQLPSDIETIHNMTKESFLNSIASRYIRNAVDWEHGSCNFESPDFIRILEAGNRIRETPEDVNNMFFGYGSVKVGEGSRVASLSWVEDVWKLAYEEHMAGKQLSFIGWPTIDGSCGSDIHLIEPIGIAKESENAEGCWAFVKFMLQSVKLEDEGLPVYRPLLVDEIDSAIQSKDTPVKMTASDGDRLLDLISATENTALYDEALLGIIKSESAAYFDGAKTASEVAKLIQSKASIYLAEQG